MAYTLEQLAGIEAIITGGTSEVEIDGRKIRYFPLPELKKLKAEIQAELGISTPATARGRVWSPTISSGL